MLHFERSSATSFIRQAHQLRLHDFQECAWADTLACDEEVEIQSRLRRPIAKMTVSSTPFETFSMSSKATISSGAFRHGVMTSPEIRDHFAMADDPEDTVREAISRLLSNLRELLDMDIALVAEFKDGHRIFRHVDVDPTQPAKLQVGESVPLEGTYCQRVIGGRLPSMIADTALIPETQNLVATQSLEIGAYLSAPVVLAHGQVYGTLCCISHQARSALGCRQTDALRSVAKLVAAEIEKNCR